MIQWLIAAPFYAPLSFESGVLSGAISMTLSHVGFKLFKFFNPTNTDTSISFLRTMRKIVSPIREIELFLHGGFEVGDFGKHVEILTVFCLKIPNLGHFWAFWVLALPLKHDFKLNSDHFQHFQFENFKTTSHKTKTTDTSQDSSSSFA